MSDRATEVASRLAPFFGPSNALLEIGAGEGHVADALRRLCGAHLTLVDVVDYNHTSLPLHTYDGQNLPFADRAFDYSLLVFVLHHTPDPVRVLREAFRVSRSGVLIVENDVEGALRKPITRAIDSLPHFRWGVPVCYHTYALTEWRNLFKADGIQCELLGRFSLNRGFWQNFVMRLSR